MQGFEVGIAGRLLPDLNIFGGYTYLDSEFVDSPDPNVEGNKLLNVPEHSATLWATYDFLEKWQIGGGPTYVSSRYNNAANDARIEGTCSGTRRSLTNSRRMFNCVSTGSI